jgi:hypothetical protein
MDYTKYREAVLKVYPNSKILKKDNHYFIINSNGYIINPMPELNLKPASSIPQAWENMYVSLNFKKILSNTKNMDNKIINKLIKKELREEEILAKQDLEDNY